MTLRLTPDVLARAYEYLRATEPFSRWRLPPSSGVRFRVGRNKKTFGYTLTSKDTLPRITISGVNVAHTFTLIRVMAHEMTHLSGPMHHGADFRRRAAVVCRRHGFDPKEF